MNQIGDFLGKPWWQGISVIFTIAGLLLALIQPRRKKLGYLIQFSESVFAEDLGFTDQLSIFYQDAVVKSHSVASIKFKNYGFLPIRSDDFHEAIEIKLIGTLRILDCQIKALNPPNLKLRYTIDDQSLLIEPTLLNSKDTFLVKIIYDGEDADIEPTCRIVGVNRMKDLDLVRQATRSLAAITVFAIISLYTLLNWAFFATSDGYGFQVFGCLALLGVVTYISVYRDGIFSDL